MVDARCPEGALVRLPCVIARSWFVLVMRKAQAHALRITLSCPTMAYRNGNCPVNDTLDRILGQLFHVGRQVKVGLYSNLALVFSSDDIGRTAVAALLNLVDDVVEGHGPVVDLVGNDDLGRQPGLAGLRAEP